MMDVKCVSCGMKKYVFKPYDPIYPTFFALEKKKLEEVLGREAKVEHVGSTAVPGLGRESLIDVLIGVPKQKIEETKKMLEKHYILGKSIVPLSVSFLSKTILMSERQEASMYTL